MKDENYDIPLISSSLQDSIFESFSLAAAHIENDNISMANIFLYSKEKRFEITPNQFLRTLNKSGILMREINGIWNGRRWELHKKRLCSKMRESRFKEKVELINLILHLRPFHRREHIKHRRSVYENGRAGKFIGKWKGKVSLLAPSYKGRFLFLYFVFLFQHLENQDSFDKEKESISFPIYEKQLLKKLTLTLGHLTQVKFSEERVKSAIQSAFLAIL